MKIGTNSATYTYDGKLKLEYKNENIMLPE